MYILISCVLRCWFNFKMLNVEAEQVLSLTLFLLLFVNQKLIQALLQFVKFSFFPFHLMIVLAGPACNYVLKFLHLAGGNKKNNCHIYVHETKNLPVDSLNIVWGSKSKESTSSFSFFRQFCKLFTFSCSCRSLSRSPVFSLLDSSSCSYDKRTALIWTFDMRVNFSVLTSNS